jgi:hypothetical protein
MKNKNLKGRVLAEYQEEVILYLKGIHDLLVSLSEKTPATAPKKRAPRKKKVSTK